MEVEGVLSPSRRGKSGSVYREPEFGVNSAWLMWPGDIGVVYKSSCCFWESSAFSRKGQDGKEGSNQ